MIWEWGRVLHKGIKPLSAVFMAGLSAGGLKVSKIACLFVQSRYIGIRQNCLIRKDSMRITFFKRPFIY